MKTYSTAITNYRAAGREFYQINLLSFKVRDRETGDPQWFHFSDRDYDETIKVINQETGEEEFRDYFGGGHIISLDPLIRSENRGSGDIGIVLSAASDQVQDMIQGYDCRDAVFEWRVGEGEDQTELMVDIPSLEFDGFVNTINRDDAACSIDSSEPTDANFNVSVISHISALQRANPDMRSQEVGQERSGDDIFQYAGEANTWETLWGKKSHQHKRDHDRGHNGRDDRGPDPNPWGHR